MDSRSRVVAVATAVTGVLVAGGQPVAADEDVPKGAPVLAWEVPVECDADADAVGVAGGSGRRCDLALARDVALVHEYPSRRDASGRFRLTARDIHTGETRWAEEVGATFSMDLTDEAVVLSDKSHVEVFDLETGNLRFTRDGGLIRHNRYGTLIIEDGPGSIDAVDAADGTELWSMSGQVGAMCRDFVAVVPAPGRPAAPFTVVDHRSGAVRWESEEPYDPETHDVACSSAPWIYVSDGSRVIELDSSDGWSTWEADVADAGDIDLYREVALVRTGAAGETVVALRRLDGTMAWQAPADSVGTSLSWVGRLRADETGLFTLQPLTGATVQRVDLGSGHDGASFDVVGVSDTRVVVARGATVTAYGMNDLGVAWELGLGAEPDDVGVSTGVLVVRTGDVLRGYAAPPRR